MIPSHPAVVFSWIFLEFWGKSTPWLPAALKNPLFQYFPCSTRESWRSFLIPMELGWVFLLSLRDFFSEPFFHVG